MVTRPNNSKQVPLNIVGSSTFGRYNKISTEATYNMFISDGWLVPYAGYEIAIEAAEFEGGVGRGFYTSENFDAMVAVIGTEVFFVKLDFDQEALTFKNKSVERIGTLQTASGIVYISENNKPQLLFSDNHSLYYYDTTVNEVTVIDGLDFTPGYIDFHDTYFLCAEVGTSNWRISESNEGKDKSDWGIGVGANLSAHQAALQTKPDRVQAVLRFPSRGNMIFVFGSTVTESWFDVGGKLFPYQRQNTYNIDYGCLSPATIATMDKLVVWLAANEKSGPIIMYSDGQTAQAISTDGIDFLLSNMQSPEDSQAFIYRQDGHIFYHINFYTDNRSIVYDFNTKSFYYATDEHRDVFLGTKVTFYNNQYYMITNQNANLYALDTIFTTYAGEQIPRIRTCKNYKLPSQDYFVITDVGFTIESGETKYIYQNQGPVNFTTEDGEIYITEGDFIQYATELNDPYITQLGEALLTENSGVIAFEFLITEKDFIKAVTPRIDMSISTDGGAMFSSYVPQELPHIGQRKNKLQWWRLGTANSMTCQFRFHGIGRFVAADGLINIRT